MELFVQRVVDGISNGAIYGAVALALVLIYKGTGLINFAQGEMAMLSTFIVYVLAVEQDMPIWLAIVLSIAISMVFAAVVERVMIRPLESRSHLAVVIVTLGLFLIINAIAGEIWLFQPRALPNPFPAAVDDFFELFGARVRYERLGIVLVLMAVLGVLFLMLQKTKIGLSFRAVAANRSSAELSGIRVGRTLQLGWALAAGMGALAGALVANNLGGVQPNMMATLLIFSFASATLGGLDSPGGAVIGGLVVGLVQSMVGGYVEQIGPELSLATALAVIIVVLLVRPTGLFGSRTVQRV